MLTASLRRSGLGYLPRYHPTLDLLLVQVQIADLIGSLSERRASAQPSGKGLLGAHRREPRIAAAARCAGTGQTHRNHGYNEER